MKHKKTISLSCSGQFYHFGIKKRKYLTLINYVDELPEIFIYKKQNFFLVGESKILSYE